MAAPITSQRLTATGPTTGRWMHWLVLAAFVLATLAPVLAAVQGDTSAGRTLLASFCHADGTEVYVLEIPLDGAADDTPSSGSGFCLLCVYPTVLPGWSMPSGQVAVRPLTFTPRPSVAPRATDLWHPARARAPPALT